QLGDDALKLAASTITEVAQRPGDVSARYGGDQFAVLLPETDAMGARVVAEHIDSAIRALGLPAADGADIMTVSIGVAAEFGGEKDTDSTASTLISNALSDLERARMEAIGATAESDDSDDFML
ncbi:MAG: GGDEF domain-containing protein, partial [Gammaproteobacteria bacterium]